MVQSYSGEKSGADKPDSKQYVGQRPIYWNIEKYT